jgi:hypothetical protein
MTWPVTPIQSPIDKAPSSSKRGVPAAVAKSWTRPLWSWRVPKASLPCTRRSMSRPATLTSVPVSTPASSAPNSSCSDAAVRVGSNR